MSACKTCRTDIVWVSREDGSWHRPLERLRDVTGDDLAEQLDLHKLFVVLDGELVSVRASGLYVPHVCPPDEVVVATRVDAPELEELDVDRLDEGDELDEGTGEITSPPTRRVWEKPVTPWRDRYEGAELVDCPKCGRPADEPCRNLTHGRWAGMDTQFPHADRLEYARGAGVLPEVGLIWRHLTYYPTERQRQLLTPWLREYGHILTQPPEVPDAS